jgi:hypothetical protein
MQREPAALATQVRSCELKAWVVGRTSARPACARSSISATPSAMRSRRAWAIGEWLHGEAWVAAW